MWVVVEKPKQFERLLNMALLDGDDALYEFENDERLSVEAKVALGLMRESHVTVRYFLRLLAETFGADIAAKAQEFAHEANLARIKQQVDTVGAANRVLIKSCATKTADTAKTEEPKNEPADNAKNAPVSESDKNISAVPKKTLAPKGSGAAVSNRSGGAKG